MSYLDVTVPQLVSSQAALGDQSSMMRATIQSAENEVLAAQAFHMGDSAAAFQAAHARFVEASTQINMLLDIAQANMGESAGTYVAADAGMAADLAHTTTILGT